MRFIQALSTGIILALCTSVNAWNRLEKDNAALLIIDYQVGLAQLVRDYGTNDFRNNMLAHAALGKTFDLPVVMTTSSDFGPNGQMLKEILDMYPNTTVIRREGEVNAWDNADFRAAVAATGKRQLIIGGIVTEVCTTFLALSLIDEGYEVYANTEGSGTFDPRLAVDANRRMEAAGVTLMGWWAILCDLFRDWRHVPGLTELLPTIDKYLFAYGLVARHHGAAIVNGTLAEIQRDFIAN
ncbi:Isochorismatase-like protein [Aspergillus pseudoustus]|uniref:Isochorismatase-like protein n=1 Tax=Aspergillus pseudoustus TaxID=1810923 RepID=A0ABR4KGD1_9EURO